MASSDYFNFKRAFELSPIIFTGGIAQLAGGSLPIISITDSAAFSSGPLAGGSDLDFDDFFAHFEPAPGSTLIENEIAHLPFANQVVAANAIIVDPLRISLIMKCPAQTDNGGFQQRYNTFAALKSALDQHIAQAGTFTIATPAYLYTSCLLVSLRDISPPPPGQPQSVWQWEFEQTLITLQQAQQAYSVSMSKIGARTQSTGDPPSLSGASPNVGTSTGVGGARVVPAQAPMPRAAPSVPLAFPNFGP